MAAKNYAFVFYFILLFGHVLPSLTSTMSTEDKLALLEQTVQSMQNNLSDVRQHMATSDSLRLYLTQEVKFRDQLEQQLKEMTENYTALQDLYLQTKLEQEIDIRTLRNNLSSLYSHYNATKHQMQVEIHGLQARLVANKQDSNAALRNSSQHTRQMIDNVTRGLLLNISSLRSSINHFMTMGKYLF